MSHAWPACASGRDRRPVVLLLATVFVLGSVPAARAVCCVGDCNGDRSVTVDELTRGVSIALDAALLPDCPALDDGSNVVGVAALVRATRNALDGCLSEVPRTIEGAPVERRVFFGDLHVHSAQHPSLLSRSRAGLATPLQAFAVARDCMSLDFMALSDHDTLLKPELWERARAAAAAVNVPGTFVAFSAVEWTRVWHVNVVFQRDDEAFFESATGVEFNRAYAARVRDGSLVAHVNHPNFYFPPDWSIIDDRVTTNAEVWNAMATGSQEHGILGVLWALRAGFRVGLIGVSDDHVTRARRPLLGRGITGCHAESLSRASILHSLRNRRCYATTGPRIILDTSVGGTPMGGVTKLKMGAAADVAVSVLGEAPFVIELVKSNAVVDRKRCESAHCELASTVVLRDPSDFVYARIRQSNGGRAWSSPVWLEGECAGGPGDASCLSGRLANGRLASEPTPGGEEALADRCLTQILFPEDSAQRGYEAEPVAMVRCVDGDPLCDVGDMKGTCEVEFGLCFGLADHRLAQCQPVRPDSLEIVQPVDDPGALTLSQANRATLAAVFRAASTGGKPACSPMSRLLVSAGDRQVFDLVSRAAERSDRDTLVVECVAPGS